ncbi:hypothetical protein [Streptomyces phaeoluteigriseus]|uniref:hypothetical protein n=1 Tax=Streptomyces phaeoluteigriseus TaxID=114686 RepID=UPI001B87613D|nr:hypothetical protein [Streptomyces phaeoluteigriseus]
MSGGTLRTPVVPPHRPGDILISTVEGGTDITGRVPEEGVRPGHQGAAAPPLAAGGTE